LEFLLVTLLPWHHPIQLHYVLKRVIVEFGCETSCGDGIDDDSHSKMRIYSALPVLGAEAWEMMIGWLALQQCGETERTTSPSQVSPG
jgi:hypothetical protein